MTRERWFYAEDYQRRGPVPLGQLVDSVLTQREPRSALVWRKGYRAWTRAEDVPEVRERIAPVLTRREAEEAELRAPAPATVEASVAPPPPVSRSANPHLLYGGLVTGVVVTGLVAWLLWPHSETAAPPQVVPLGGTTAENAPAVVIPAPTGTVEAPAPAASQTATAPAASQTATAPPAPTPPPDPTDDPTPPATATAPAATIATPTPTGIGDEERDVPLSEVRKLRQVAAWSGTRLELTVVNDTAWRITELYVQVQSFVGNEVVEGSRPILLLPPGEAVDDEVASLLSRVAPDRRKPGVNPLDTGTFSGEAGPRPDGFRCDIVSARGYAPR